jgi:hypothetical protein
MFENPEANIRAASVDHEKAPENLMPNKNSNSAKD